MSPDTESVLAYVGLGSNLGRRAHNISRAIEALGRADENRVVAASPLYESEPLDAEGGRFLNGAIALETTMSARALLALLLETEAALGRLRPGRGRRVRNRLREDVELSEARSIDLDLLLYGDAWIEEDGLVVPHPRLDRRLFVLQPLVDLCPDLRMPTRDGRLKHTVAELCRDLAATDPEQALVVWKGG